MKFDTKTKLLNLIGYGLIIAGTVGLFLGTESCCG